MIAVLLPTALPWLPQVHAIHLKRGRDPQAFRVDYTAMQKVERKTGLSVACATLTPTIPSLPMAGLLAQPRTNPVPPLPAPPPSASRPRHPPHAEGHPARDGSADVEVQVRLVLC